MKFVKLSPFYLSFWKAWSFSDMRGLFKLFKNFLSFSSLDLEKSLLKFFILTAKTFISGNVRDFLEQIFLIFLILKSSLQKFFIPRTRKKILRADAKKGAFCFPKYKNGFFWENIWNFLRTGFYRKKIS